MLNEAISGGGVLGSVDSVLAKRQIDTGGRPAAAPAAAPGFRAFGDDGPTFFDVLDIVNPLQHIPVVSTLYRELTGDRIDPVPRMAGGALFGGLIGALASIVNVVVDEISGKDVGEHVMALFDSPDEPDGDGADVVLAAFPTSTAQAPTPAATEPEPDFLHEHGEVLEWAQREHAQRQMQDPLAAIAPPVSFAAWVPEPPARAAQQDDDVRVASTAPARYQHSAMLIGHDAPPAVDLSG